MHIEKQLTEHNLMLRLQSKTRSYRMPDGLNMKTNRIPANKAGLVMQDVELVHNETMFLMDYR